MGNNNRINAKIKQSNNVIKFTNEHTRFYKDINDDYFYSLASLNSAMLSTTVAISFNPNLNAFLLGVTRVTFNLMNYLVSYLFYPKRIIRTLRAILKNDSISSTVFEHRLLDLINKAKASKKQLFLASICDPTGHWSSPREKLAFLYPSLHLCTLVEKMQIPGKITAVLGPTNTGKTHLAIERMLGHRTGIIGCPLRLLAREIYDKVVLAKGSSKVALITGEEKIIPHHPKFYVCTTESMPTDRSAEFLAVDEIQLAAVKLKILRQRAVTVNLDMINMNVHAPPSP